MITVTFIDFFNLIKPLFVHSGICRQTPVITVFLNEGYYLGNKHDNQIYHGCPEVEFVLVEIQEIYKVSKDFPKKEIYRGNNIGKLYLSIDLKEANFQALRFYDPAIVRDCETWGEFIGKWSDSEYLKKTKLNRQRLLGKLSPEKQSIIETYIMVGIHELFLDRWNLELVSLKTDEIIYQIPKELDKERLLGDALWISKNDMGVNVNAEIFELQPLQLFTHHGNSIFGFAKKIYGQKYPKFKDIPKMYIPQFVKYYEGRIEEVNDLDLAFIAPQDDELAKFIYPLHQ